jgi:hypothetical protein
VRTSRHGLMDCDEIDFVTVDSNEINSGSITNGTMGRWHCSGGALAIFFQVNATMDLWLSSVASLAS